MHIDRRILCDGNKTTRTTMNGIQLHRWSCFVQSPGKTLFCTWNYSCFCHKKKTTKNQKKLNEFSQRQTNKFPHKMLLWSNAFPRFCMLVVFVLLNVLIFFFLFCWLAIHSENRRLYARLGIRYCYWDRARVERLHYMTLNWIIFIIIIIIIKIVIALCRLVVLCLRNREWEIRSMLDDA